MSAAHLRSGAGAEHAVRPATAAPISIVTNRLPYSFRERRPGEWETRHSSGGLVSALEPLARQGGGTWVGWPGVAQPPRDDGSLQSHVDGMQPHPGYTLVPVPLARHLVDGFYEGFSNRVVWPLFHGLPVEPVGCSAWVRAYREANRAFARATLRHAPPDGLLWIHDYHLMLLASELRRAGFAGRLAFFLHTPFPPVDLFARLPCSRALVASLLEFDLLGFQTRRDLDNFRGCAAAAGAGRPGGGVRALPRRAARGAGETRLGHFPIGIDAAGFEARARSPEARSASAALRERHRGRHILLGVDRLDRSKGLRHKLAAFEQALERWPDLARRVTLIQQVIPSREGLPEHRALRDELEARVARINARFGSGRWQPVEYRYGSLSPVDLVAHYRAARVALVTPLRDGMNLVAKEYCAANVDECGVLVLSEFAGAADQLGATALTVNPFDVDGMASAIHAAVRMAPEERRRRMRALRARVRRDDVHWWARSYMQAANASGSA